MFLRKSSGGLDLLTEAKLQRRFRPPGSELLPLYAGYYVAELLWELTDHYDAHPLLFDAADRCLVLLAEGREVRPLIFRFELTALRLLGHVPSLSRCVECGQPVEPAARIPFGPLAGGVLCGRCRPGKRHVVSLSKEAWSAMRRFADPADDAWQAEPLPAGVGGELRGAMNYYLSHLVGHLLKMLPYLGHEGTRGSATSRSDNPAPTTKNP